MELWIAKALVRAARRARTHWFEGGGPAGQIIGPAGKVRLPRRMRHMKGDDRRSRTGLAAGRQAQRGLLQHGLLGAAFCACTAALYGGQPLSLPDCIRLARQAQSSATIARRQLDIARYGLRAARAGFLPQSRLSNGWTYNSPLAEDRSTFSYVALNGIREYVTLFNASLELDTAGRLRAELARARAEHEAAQAVVRLSERDLARSVTAAYLRTLLARRLVEATRDSLAEARSFEERVRLLFAGGEAARADLLKAQAETAFLEQELNAAELEAQLAAQELASFWTEAVDQPLELAASLSEPVEPPPETPGGERPFLRRPEFSLLEAQRRQGLADARRARADWLPQLGLTFQYGLDANALRWGARGYAAFLSLQVPVFDWLKTHSAVRQSELRLRQVEAGRAIAERNFAREYQGALARVRAWYAQIGLAGTQLRASEENLRLSRLRYEGGEGSALEVVAAQRQLTQARANYYTVLANYLNARADWEVASGR